MDVERFIGLFVRLFRVFLVYNGVHATLRLSDSIIAIITSEPLRSGISFSAFFQQILLVLFYLVVGIYLIKDGLILFRLLNKRISEKRSD